MIDHKECAMTRITSFASSSRSSSLLSSFTRHTRKRRLRLIRSAAAAASAAILLGIAAPKAAAQSTATWNGGVGVWGAATNWDGGFVPNSGTVSVFIDGGNTATSNVTLN